MGATFPGAATVARVVEIEFEVGEEEGAKLKRWGGK